MRPLVVLSLGGGVQSSTLALLAAHGEVTPMPDAAVFADTQAEPKDVYDWLARLAPLLPFPILRVSGGSLYDHAGRMPWRVASPRDGGGLLSRACTHRLKVRPQEQALRFALQFEPGQVAERWIGFSLDEAHRMKPSQQKWWTARWPLIEKKMTRHDCLVWMRRQGYSEPPKSACIMCPFRSDERWLELKRKNPREFEAACRFEEQEGPRVAKYRAYFASFAETSAGRALRQSQPRRV